MEQIEKVLSLVFVGVGILAYIITTILAIRRKKANGEKVNAADAIAEIADNVLGFVKTAEGEFDQCGMGVEKLKSVLTATKILCKDANVIFDKSYWTDYINKAVDLINIAKNNADKIPLE